MPQEEGQHVSEAVHLHVDTDGEIERFDSDEAKLRLLYQALAGELGDDVAIEINTE